MILYLLCGAVDMPLASFVSFLYITCNMERSYISLFLSVKRAVLLVHNSMS